MNGKGSLTIEESVEKTWDGLFNPDILEKCMMGCKKLNLVDQNKYKAVLSIGIPPVNGKYDATIEIDEIEKWKTYKLMINAEGSAGTVEAKSLINLVRLDELKTALHYDFDAAVGGKVAKFGGPILNGVGKMLLQDFFKKFGRELKKTKTQN
ncbi:CoxG family protein [Bacillus salitolerans]|uniref:CoxG family protein n=1 Tax=Bacillus salitolerans TaxID=1437434 RepID=A0ABW4LQF1_9BACI